ncbi:MAG TPA: sugar phosphate isomerase/epimerase family protein [Pirellulales bacterium]|nr:sugar phosphate isomerase/epimerase family protein [Pirellulales bacterium]
MKLAICNETFLDWPLERALHFAAECGYTGVEFAPFTLAADPRQISAAERARTARLTEGAGLEVVGLHWLLAKTEGFHLTSPDADVRRRTAEYLSDLSRLCRDLGGRVMVFGSPKQRQLIGDVTPAAGTDYAVEVFSACLPALEETDTVIAVEPLDPGEGNFINTAADAVKIIERVASPHCRLLLDCKAMASEQDSHAELIERHRSLLCHFHVNDPNRQGPGFGRLDFRPILEALGRIDYRGWVSVEVFDYSPGVERLASESASYLQGVLAEIAEEA